VYSDEACSFLLVLTVGMVKTGLGDLAAYARSLVDYIELCWLGASGAR